MHVILGEGILLLLDVVHYLVPDTSQHDLRLERQMGVRHEKKTDVVVVAVMVVQDFVLLQVVVVVKLLASYTTAGKRKERAEATAGNSGPVDTAHPAKRFTHRTDHTDHMNYTDHTDHTYNLDNIDPISVYMIGCTRYVQYR